jgi:hypothetical protein
MRIIRFLTAVALCWIAVPAAHSQSTSPYTAALPQIAYGGTSGAGGNWQTKIVITNLTASAQNITINYFDTNGNPLMVPFAGVPTAQQTLNVPANGQLEVVPDSTGANTVVGWAGLTYADLSLGIQGVFTWQNGANLTEAVAPIVSQSGAPCIIPLPVNTVYTMPFDQTNPAGGLISAFAFANTLSTPVTMTLNFFDQNGNSLGSYTPPAVPGNGHIQFGLGDSEVIAAAPMLVGAKGSMQISGTGVVPLGFKFFGKVFTTWLP